jgi:hypothetical protein
MVLNDLPSCEMIYQQAQRWIVAKVFEAMVHDLHELLRMAAGRASDPTAATSRVARVCQALSATWIAGLPTSTEIV